MWDKAVKEGGIKCGEILTFGSMTNGKSTLSETDTLIAITRSECEGGTKLSVLKLNTETGEYVEINK